MTGYAFLETTMDPTWQTQEGENFLNGGPARGGLGPSCIELQGAIYFFEWGRREPEKLRPTSICDLDGRTRSREIPGVGKGLTT